MGPAHGGSLPAKREPPSSRPLPPSPPPAPGRGRNIRISQRRAQEPTAPHPTPTQHPASSSRTRAHPGCRCVAAPAGGGLQCQATLPARLPAMWPVEPGGVSACQTRQDRREVLPGRTDCLLPIEDAPSMVPLCSAALGKPALGPCADGETAQRGSPSPRVHSQQDQGSQCGRWS